MSEQHNRITTNSYATYLLLLGTSIFWGSAFVFSKVAESSVPPLVAALLRFGLGAVVGLVLILGLHLRDRRYRLTPGGAWLDTLALGVMGVTVYNIFFFLGLFYSQASDGSMIIPTLSPVFTVVLAVLLLKERFRKQQVFGIAITLFGALLFFSVIFFLRSVAAHHRAIGDALFLGSAVFWASSTMFSKRVTSKVDPLIASTYAMVFGSIIVGIIAVPELLKVHWLSLGWRFWVDVVYLAVLPSVLANWFYYLGVKRIGPARASAFMFLVPVSALVLSVLVLGESLTLVQLVGAVLMLVGVWMINRKV